MTLTSRQQWIIIAVLVIGVPFAAWHFAVRYQVLNRIPNELQVSGIEYQLEENWGSVFMPLPGDNETGLVVYSIPAKVAEQVAAEGVAFFMRPEHIEKRTGRQITHSEWKETPILRDGAWGEIRKPERAVVYDPLKPSIDEYLDKYGFFIPVDKAVIAMVDEAISKPGSFYSYGRTGLIIVIPSIRKVVYAYAG